CCVSVSRPRWTRQSFRPAVAVATCTRRRSSALFFKAAARAGVEGKVSPHWLRQSHATHALERGAPIHLVQGTLGHASVATTGRYLHARPTDSSSRFLAV